MNRRDVRVLILDDDRELLKTYEEYLLLKHFVVASAASLPQFYELLETFDPHILILDKYIGSLNTGEVIGFLRAQEKFKNLPIIVITGHYSVEETISTLFQGADDHLLKPVVLDELHARIIANLRRSMVYQEGAKIVSAGPFKLFLDSNRATMDGAELRLTRIEFGLLAELLLNAGKLISRDDLAEKWLTLRSANSRNLDVHVSYLRTKIGSYGNQIKTLRSKGYLFVPFDEAKSHSPAAKLWSV